MSIKTYQSAQDKTTDARRIEMVVFQKCNALLEKASSARTQPSSSATPLDVAKQVAQALYQNDLVWSSLVADLASDDNKLPEALRAQLISLGLWAQRYADDVRRAKASFDPLINLNCRMIEGLNASLASARPNAILPMVEANHAPSSEPLDHCS
ncbi:MAG: flagellar biosynthesis regulator FlaF [Rhodospirillales bacterium]|nr:flagellar biosynthesis regulator FlaF [Rhodospirillales bacterium]